jgi:hypothetical protein
MSLAEVIERVCSRRSTQNLFRNLHLSHGSHSPHGSGGPVRLGSTEYDCGLDDCSNESGFGHSLFHACPIQSQSHEAGGGGIVSVALYHAVDHYVGLRVARMVK